MMDLPEPLAVVCHDAGAANLILPWIAAGRPNQLLPVMQGPAATLWQKRFQTVATLTLEDALSEASALLTGTGWGSDLEHRARRIAREREIPSTAVIDHWVNYRERFVRDGEEVLPDQIWVTDEYALEISKKLFGDVPAILKPNLYLEEQVASVSEPAENDQDILFVAEPVSSNWERGLPGEFQALDYFIARRDDAGIPRTARMRLRPHPSDPPDKYDAWITRHPGVLVDRSEDLAGALERARWVVGCESYALVVGLFAGRQAISALPPWAPPCRLPHDDIIRLASI